MLNIVDPVAKEVFEQAGFDVQIQDEAHHWKIHAGSVVVNYWPTTQRAFVFAKSFNATAPQLTKALQAGRIRMPPSRQSVCTGCQAPIWWLPSSRKKYLPVDESGESHFSTCPDRDKFK